MYDIIIIGGGTAGLTAAIYACRAGKKTLVLEGEVFGGQITASPRVENFPGIELISGNEFADKLYNQAEALGAQIEYEAVSSVEKTNEGIFTVNAENTYKSKTLILASGSSHKHLSLQREEEFSGKGVSYCAVCDGAFFKGKTVAVVGGGSAALQSAELLCDMCKKVYLIHRRSEFRGEKLLAERVLSRDNIEFLPGAVVEALEGENELSEILVNQGGERKNIELSGLFIAIGQEPHTKLFENFVKLDENGYVAAGEDCKTSCKGVFAAGDCRTKKVRQLVTAAADGAIAALSCVELC